MANNCGLWINMFSAKVGIPNVSPRTLMTVIVLDYSKHCRFPFRSYVQVHDKPIPTNSPTARTVGAITLGPTGNLQWGYKILNLRTGKKITIRNWTYVPMSSRVIERINKIGSAHGQHKLITLNRSSRTPKKQFRSIFSTIVSGLS